MAGEFGNRKFHLFVISFILKCITLNLGVVQNNTITINKQGFHVLVSLSYL